MSDMQRKIGQRQSDQVSRESLSPSNLARQFAPVLVLWPEIPALENPPLQLREQYGRKGSKAATRRNTSVHITRDFHPRDVHLILDHAQSYLPRSPLPFVPTSIALAYRDFARFFFLPIILLVLLALLIVAFAQPLPVPWQAAIEVGTLAAAGLAYAVTLRSPMHVPVDHWHLVNHMVAGAGVAVIAATIVGFDDLAILAPFLVVPALTSLLFWFLSRVVLIATLPVQLVRLARRRLVSADEVQAEGSSIPDLQEEATELFFRYPGTNQAMHRANRDVHWQAYAELLKKADYPPAYYARILEPDPDGIILIQYWFCYYYDDWANEHQGDWEQAVILVRDGVPVAVAASQHEAGEYREWADIEIRGDRPVLYVAAGSHAMYFTPGINVTTRQVGDLEFSSVDASLIGAQVMDLLDITPMTSDQMAVLDNAEVVVIPDPDPESGVWGKDEHGRDFSWLNYGGRWGGRAFGSGGASGPRGPAYAGLRWDDPRMWAETVCRRKSLLVTAGLAR